MWNFCAKEKHVCFLHCVHSIEMDYDDVHSPGIYSNDHVYGNTEVCAAFFIHSFFSMRERKEWIYLVSYTDWLGWSCICQYVTSQLPDVWLMWVKEVAKKEMIWYFMCIYFTYILHILYIVYIFVSCNSYYFFEKVFHVLKN